MTLEQAIEMTEALNLDNEHGISTLGADGDEIATALLVEIKRLLDTIEALEGDIEYYINN